MAGIEDAIAVDVGVDDEIGRVGDDHLVADHGDAERRHERGFLHERRGLVGPAVAIGVFEHHDAIPFWIALLVAPVVHAFGDPDAPRRIDVDVGGVLEHGRARPERDFEPFGHREDVERNDGRRGGRRRRIGRDTRSLRTQTGRQAEPAALQSVVFISLNDPLRTNRPRRTRR